MFKAMDIRSAVIGGLLVLLVLSCLGALPWLPQEYSGRFTVGTTDGSAFILDTATGQAWAYVVPTGVSHPHMVDFFGPKLDFESEADGPAQ